MEDAKNLMEEIMESIRDLESDIKKCEESRDSTRSLVLKNRYLDILEQKELVDSCLRYSKGGKNEVIFPTA